MARVRSSILSMRTSSLRVLLVSSFEFITFGAFSLVRKNLTLSGPRLQLVRLSVTTMWYNNEDRASRWCGKLFSTTGSQEAIPGPIKISVGVP